MGYSSLCRSIVPAASDNYTHGRLGYKVCKITPHHMSGVLTGEQCARLFQNSSRDASANYCIGNDGGIVGNVDENNRAWTSSSRTNDCQAITIEVSNSSTGGNWPISDAAWNALINLCVDICRRYGFSLVYDGTPNGSLTRHNMFSNTDCPGPYLQSKLPELANIVNSRLGSGYTPAPIPAPSTGHKVGDVVSINGVYTASNSTKKLKPAKTSGTITRIISGALNPYLLDNGNLGWVNNGCITGGGSSASSSGGSSLDAVAQAVIAGNYGNGDDRKRRLQAAGYDYNAVQQRVNQILGGGRVSSTPSYNLDDVARRVIRGDFGNGEERKRRLQAAGYDYNAVQKRVNQML